MLRILLLFTLVALCAIAAALLADYPGALTVNWGIWEIRTSFSLGLVALGLFALALLAVHRLYLGLRRTPGRFAIGWAGRQRRRGLDALSKGLVAAATGDGPLALKYANQAERLLEHPPLTQLLSAQAAQLTGNDEAAAKHFNAMLDHKETEVLGRQGLLLQAASKGDTEEALKHAARAFEKNPKADGAYKTLFDLQLTTGNWQSALTTLEKGRKENIIPQEQSRKQKAVLLTALASAKGIDTKEGEKAAQKAHKLSPGFTPAALLAVKIHQNKEQMWKASGLLEEAWRAAPHPALVEAYVALKPEESARERAKRVSGLAEMSPEHMESQLLLARQAINTKDWPAARTALATLAEKTPTPRVCALMAEIERGEAANEGAAREWLARAATAPPEADWIRSSFDFSDAEWADLVRQMASQQEAWPPVPDPDVFARAHVVAPFTEELQVISEEPASTDSAEDTASEETLAESSTAAKTPDLPAHKSSLRSVRSAGAPLISLNHGSALKSRRTAAPLESQGHLTRQPDDPGPVKDASEEDNADWA